MRKMMLLAALPLVALLAACDGSPTGPNTTPTPTPTPAPRVNSPVVLFDGLTTETGKFLDLKTNQEVRWSSIKMPGPGTVTVELDWSTAKINLWLAAFRNAHCPYSDDVFNKGKCDPIGTAMNAGQKPKILTFPVTKEDRDVSVLVLNNADNFVRSDPETYGTSGTIRILWTPAS